MRRPIATFLVAMSLVTGLLVGYMQAELPGQALFDSFAGAGAF
jgi:hypothetical protein